MTRFKSRIQDSFGFLAPLVLGSLLSACGGAVDETALEGAADDGGASVDAGAEVSDDAPTGDAAVVDVAEAPYPGPHPAMPEMPSHGGAVLATPDLVTVTFASDALASFAETFDDFLVGTAWWPAVHDEYGVGKATSTKHVRLEGAAPGAITDAELQTWLKDQIGAGNLPVPDDQTLYVLYFPRGTSITLAGAGQSCSAFGGYHDATWVDVGGGKTVNAAYAVIPRCGNRGNDLTVTVSHEVTEAATDPRPRSARAGYNITEQIAWNLAGGENADLCEFVSPVSEGGYDLTRAWSNANARIGQQPCVPVPPDPTGTPYFNAGVTNEDVYAKAGESVVVDVQCYSFGPLPNPITVEAQPFSAQNLDFSFSPSTCKNGETIKMTITVSPNARAGTTYHYSLLASISADIGHLWRGQVTVE